MLKTIQGLFLILMLDCEQSARLTSESFDRPLSKTEILALGIHQFLCRSSHRVARQMEMMARAMKEQGISELQLSADRLPEDARERIRKMLRENQDF